VVSSRHLSRVRQDPSRDISPGMAMAERLLAEDDLVGNSFLPLSMGVHRQVDSNQGFLAHSSLRADPNIMASNSVPQPRFSSQQGARQTLPSCQAPYLTQPGHEPYWGPPNLHSPQPASSYQSASSNALPGAFYGLQEPLEQAWLPDTEHNSTPTIVRLDPGQRWLHYQDNTGIVYTGPADVHGLPDVESRPSFPHTMDDNAP